MIVVSGPNSALSARLPLNPDRTCFCYVTLGKPVFDKIVNVGKIEPISLVFTDPLKSPKTRVTLQNG